MIYTHCGGEEDEEFEHAHPTPNKIFTTHKHDMIMFWLCFSQILVKAQIQGTEPGKRAREQSQGTEPGIETERKPKPKPFIT